MKGRSVVTYATALATSVVLLASGCQGLEANGTVVGRLLANRGTALREAAPLVGIAGQQVVMVDALHGSVAATATTDDEGSFRLSVPAGNYVVQSGATRQYVHITAGEQLRVNLTAPVP